MNFKYTLIIFSFALLQMACDSAQSSQNDAFLDQLESNPTEEIKRTASEEFVYSIERAHAKEALFKKELIQFDLDLKFGGKQRFLGTITMTPSGSQIKMSDSSRTIIWDGKEVYLTPDTANEKGARFGVLTWSYFFAAPYKFSDPGANLELLGNQSLQILSAETIDSTGVQYNSAKLTFGSDVGDSPDDWYIIYQAENSKQLAAMAYIVTYGNKNQDEAEEDPHAITYEAYTAVEGIPFATQWNFWAWNTNGDLTKLLGEANITNVQFLKKSPDLFKPSDSFKIVGKPEV